MSLYNYLSFYLVLLNFFCLFVSSFIWVWFFLEICFVLYLVMLALSEKNNSVVLIYFFVQFMSSMMILAGFMFGLGSTNFYSVLLISVGLLLKLGVIPFHLWFISMALNMSWINMFWLMTVQKFIPLLMFSMFCPLEFSLLVYILLINSVVCSFYSLKLKSLKSIFAYSSVYHTSWILMNSFCFSAFIFYYLLFYSFIIFGLFKLFSIFYMYKYINLGKMGLLLKVFFFFLMFSYCGFPPLSGFVLKWMSTFSFLNADFHFYVISTVIFSSFLFMFNYMKLIFFSLNIFGSDIKSMHVVWGTAFSYIFLLVLLFGLVALSLFFIWIYF